MADNLRSNRRRNQSAAASVSGESVIEKESVTKSVKSASRGRGKRGRGTTAPSPVPLTAPATSTTQPIGKKRTLDDDSCQQHPNTESSETTIDDIFKNNNEFRDADEEDDIKSKQNDSINNNNVKRSSRLRKSSNKYSNFEVSNVGPTKRKSTSELSVDIKPVSGVKRTRRIKADDESQSQQEEIEDTKTDINEENSDEALSIKELKRIEKKLLKEKKEIEDQLVKGENEELSINEEPKSPIRIKITKSPNETSGGFKVNLGELVRNCKSKLGLLSSSRKNSSESNDKVVENELKPPVEVKTVVDERNEELKEEPDELIVGNEEEKAAVQVLDKLEQVLEVKTTNEINNVDGKEAEKCVEDKASTNSPGTPKRSFEELKKIFEIKEMKNKKLIDEIRSSYEQLIREIKYNNELKIREILEESVRDKVKLKIEYERKVMETKQKQWCGNCGKEAIYYCCWNTSYCDEECQKIHWNIHLKTCSRVGSNYANESNSSLNCSSENNMANFAETNGNSNSANNHSVNHNKNINNNPNNTTNIIGNVNNSNRVVLDTGKPHAKRVFNSPGFENFNGSLVSRAQSSSPITSRGQQLNEQLNHQSHQKFNNFSFKPKPKPKITATSIGPMAFNSSTKPSTNVVGSSQSHFYEQIKKRITTSGSTTHQQNSSSLNFTNNVNPNFTNGLSNSTNTKSRLQ